ncbi:hypothetical protein GM418_14600 [Maribellus comscasis]|uniref:Uncharacterized protein n=1 Tax=Maribellus comscasis TaxID=2681766 RepID=A0A6I6JXI7_9BACT|nr:hypothetical protein [Maribellus comscasis]QGY44852.1 hypothetical protein GM418_14600 [Maribellus comscasis]
MPSIPPVEDPKRPYEPTVPKRNTPPGEDKTWCELGIGLLCSEKSVLIPGTLFGGEELEKGTLHGGEELSPGTLHGGEELEKGTLHGGEELEKGTLHGGEELSPGTLHQQENGGDSPLLPFSFRATYSPASYRTKDGKGVFKFQYMDRGSYFDIDIIEEPAQSRNKPDHICHRLPARTAGRKKICFDVGKSPTTISQAKGYSTQWAELIQTYITTGKTPDKQLDEKSGGQKKGFWSWFD